MEHPGFFERAARSRDDLNTMIRYVEENPVKAGIADTTGSYPYAKVDMEDYARLVGLGRYST